MNESLIELVRQHDVLFDVNNPDYRNLVTRQEAWETIARELNIDPEIAKSGWDRLRRCYINALHRRRNHKNEQPATKRTRWKYEKQMSFLVPFIEHYRKIPLPSIDEENKNIVVPYEVAIPSTIVKVENEIDIRPNIENNPVVPAKKESAVQTTSKNTPEEKSSTVSDETDMFFLSMSKMTKALPPLEQAKIKLAVSNSVLRSQMKFFERSANGSSPQTNNDMECDVDFDPI